MLEVNNFTDALKTIDFTPSMTMLCAIGNSTAGLAEHKIIALMWAKVG